MLDPSLESSLMESYIARREEILKETISEYLDDDSYEALIDAFLSHLKSEYEFHSKKCGMLKKALELLQQGNIQ